MNQSRNYLFNQPIKKPLAHLYNYHTRNQAFKKYIFIHSINQIINEPGSQLINNQSIHNILCTQVTRETVQRMGVRRSSRAVTQVPAIRVLPVVTSKEDLNVARVHPASLVTVSLAMTSTR